MEQKQLDELNEYQGEEFIDEFVELDDIKIEPVKAKKKGKKPAKAFKTEEKGASVEAEKKGDGVHEPLPNPTEKPFPEHHSSPFPSPEAASEPADSWFSKASTWKGITGILLILLVFSFFTEGFSFKGTEISADDAQTKVLTFVNTEILQPPFYAEAKRTEDVGVLYKIELAIAGQPVNSYLTKDGALFFPQGFDTGRPLKEQLGIPEPAPEQVQLGEGRLVEEVIVDGTTGEQTSRIVPADAPVEEEDTTTFSKALKYWKWTFWPETVTVKKGQTVELTFGPDPAKKDVALESFTFSLPAFGVEQEIEGIAAVSFVADKVGEFEFFCSSCEEFRGMSGTLIVEE